MLHESVDHESAPFAHRMEKEADPMRKSSRISQEQLAAAERARLYHVRKLRAYSQSSSAAAPATIRAS